MADEALKVEWTGLSLASLVVDVSIPQFDHVIDTTRHEVLTVVAV